MRAVDYFAKWFKCSDCSHIQTNNSVIIARTGRYTYADWELMCDHHLCLRCLRKKQRSAYDLQLLSRGDKVIK